MFVTPRSDTIASPGSQDIELVVDESWADQGGGFRTGEKVWGSTGRDDPARGHIVVPVSSRNSAFGLIGSKHGR